MSPAALLFDFDGVIADSEIVSARCLAQALSEAGLPTSLIQAAERYSGLHRAETLAAIAAYWGTRTPHDIADRIARHVDSAFAAGIDPVPGAVAFIRGAAPLPIAIGSSSTTDYIRGHLTRFGLAEPFGPHVYSGREHVARGKPHPDIYLHAAAALGVDVRAAVIIEDSPVGARAAVASGARVIGFIGGSHAQPGLTAALRAEGVETVLASYPEIAHYLGLPLPAEEKFVRRTAPGG